MADFVTVAMPTALATEQIIDADKKLRRALVGGGAGKVAAALVLALFRSPGGVFVRSKALFDAYYVMLLAVAVFGAAEVGVGCWVSASPSDRRRGVGKLVVWASVVPIVVVAGLGGFAVLK
ncbi:hypothetical protein OsI_17952 [Oryza sativa Indica Group]|jgi:hypothetical protein|uniref:OSJNBa0032F06.4 protein n=6 Tax=Oryza TaxID=4527 RepID=A3AYQ2_ORYSJ|nr:hypothetical protein OsI_17952 [Oryza sativa Indica Group]EAZ32441.1 hypothetical protein OsJ_16652 [Oryza sativa Japonica Group]CAJ86274.1 H0901F07.11 [Oryza sativa]KAF2936565.1 hypothetical protein DAI22_04g312000 [Oryza sativa Japonica Group]CAE03421.1 OSJNBa0032F06.4 [Oryza sativa Japonica Group]